jgi:hypothetical protein
VKSAGSDRPRLVLAMLAVTCAGHLLRWAVSPESAGLALGPGAFLLLPVLAVAALCVGRPHPGVRWGAGLGAALAAAWCDFVLLDPQYNQDANISLGLYLLGGFVLVLGPAALLGGLLGRVLLPNAVREKPLPPLSWRGWGWPLVLPLLGAALGGWAEWQLLSRAREDYAKYHLPAPDLSLVLLGELPTLLLLLAVLALPLVLLRQQAQRQGQVHPWLGVWWATAALLTLAQFWWATWPRLGG